MMGFAVITGSTTFNAPGTYPVPKGFRSITATVTPGTPGGNGYTYVCCPPLLTPNFGPGGAGSPGGPSSFNGTGTATYQRAASTLQPRAGIAVVVGAPGTGGSGTPGAPNGPPGSPGSVVVSVA